ncbi:undecaprenyl-diphosphate phosphatase [Alicyclobacillus sp. SO9]|uniref:undecaprenyl-diphosphate phosphatase n=1 Tax=Alicyclobacillus sp. SO9 TaxID=2665646 RepID=UPI0018E8302A|nr:undecaprenyl-diphosphate phosphatase [Alicyclobacillus sp. SO9]QQE76787.1 undecaprenyl-diphosphate phosphatase [Alicyclobacillus sp. SO9]
MTSIQALVLGIIQGITEFLPISSSGHLVLVQKLWHIQGDNLLFIIFVHVGTLLAVFFAFRREITWLVKHPFSWTARMLYVALVPTAILGAVFEELFENVFSSGGTLAAEFIITGVILWWMDSVKNGFKSEDDIRFMDALWIGTLQGIAILPALSRSGLTIAGGMWRGLSKETAARFSFLLSIPAILGATLVKVDDFYESGMKTVNGSLVHWEPLLVGTVVAAAAGYISIRLTLWVLKTSRFRYFAVYTWALAAFILFDQIVTHRWFPPLF